MVYNTIISRLIKLFSGTDIRTGDKMRKYQCTVCGHVYDEAEGDPDNGVAAGTKWEDVPANWCCPDCGSTKDLFELIVE